MKHKLLDSLLLVGIAVGAVLAWRAGAERARLEAKYERLSRITGDFPVHDGNKIHILALETGEPLHFAWRVYFPPNYPHTIRAKWGGGSTTWSPTGSEEYIARVRFLDDPESGFQMYERFGGGSSRSGFGGKPLADALRGRWDEIRVEQVGRDRLEVIDPTKTVVLLRLTLTPELFEKAKAHLPYEDPVFGEITIGPPSTAP